MIRYSKFHVQEKLNNNQSCCGFERRLTAFILEVENYVKYQINVTSKILKKSDIENMIREINNVVSTNNFSYVKNCY